MSLSNILVDDTKATFKDIKAKSITVDEFDAGTLTSSSFQLSPPVGAFTDTAANASIGINLPGGKNFTCRIAGLSLAAGDNTLWKFNHPDIDSNNFVILTPGYFDLDNNAQGEHLTLTVNKVITGQIQINVSNNSTALFELADVGMYVMFM